MSERPTIHHRDRALNEQQGAYMNTVETLIETTARIASHARTLAAFLDTIPADLEPPTHMYIESYLDTPQVAWLLFGDKSGQAKRAAAIIRGIGGHWDKKPNDLFTYATERMGVQVRVVVDREKVCRRVVTGTREVATTVPDPGVAVPVVTVIEIVEDVEWVCEPLLAEAAS